MERTVIMDFQLVEGNKKLIEWPRNLCMKLYMKTLGVKLMTKRLKTRIGECWVYVQVKQSKTLFDVAITRTKMHLKIIYSIYVGLGSQRQRAELDFINILMLYLMESKTEAL